ncbi:MAG: polysaccharide lyase 8 family protein [Kiritimatiellia bacterium]|jgi:chondroitin AC lyase|nr:polysaccharide lyase 8 family protein [Kiritimatiellia bacterium]MDP6847337.1 polysaccharide lyase 8 family protein [Kiritimatiellia bacterium]
MSTLKRLLCVLCLAASATLASAQSNDFAVLRDRVRADVLRSSPGHKEAAHYVGTIEADGTWRDINYGDPRRSNWAPAIHLNRLLGMACAHQSESHPLHDDPELNRAVHGALGNWLEHRYKCRNWWFNVIHVPTVLGKILIVMGDNATQSEKQQAVRIMSPVRIGRTGQNRVWQSTVVFMRGLLEEDASLVRSAVSAIRAELKVTTGEGVQPDFSFHQHGPQQQFGNYGLAFGDSMLWWIGMLNDTSFRLGRKQKEILSDYLLNGQNWIVWNGVMDISSCGRQLKSPSGKGRALSGIMERMIPLDPDNEEPYRAFVERNSGNQDSTYALNGNRHFWRSDYMVHRRPHYFASVKMCSKRVQGSESGNGENLQGYHLGDGATYLYMHGNEYRDILPAWNWRRLPGVTCHQTNAPLPVLGWQGYRNNSDFVGGVSDGEYGAACMHYNRDGLTAKKAWFFLDAAFACLGTDIRSTSKNPVSTTVEQSLAAEEVFACRGHRIFICPEETKTFEDWKWIINGRAGYLFPGKSKISVSARKHKGSWKSITSNLSNAPVVKKIFTVSVDHGTAPHDGNYAYVVLPGIDKRRLAAHSMASDIHIVRNDSDVQAVAHLGLGIRQAVFHQPGTIRFSWGRTLEVDEPCLIMIRSQSGTTSLSVADPTQSKKSINVKLDGRRLAFQLPQDGHAGSTVTKQIR